MLVVGGVGGVDLGSSMFGEQRGQRFVEQCGIVEFRPQISRILEQRFVDGGADSDPRHAIIMPQLCHLCNVFRLPPRRPFNEEIVGSDEPGGEQRYFCVQFPDGVSSITFELTENDL